MPAASVAIPATAWDRLQLSASSAWIPPPTAAQRAAFSARTGKLLPGEQHAVNLVDLTRWRSAHPDERLRPPVGTDGAADKTCASNYRAPQHPASHVLHSIPPRAPSRSSRSNILSYTIHLATSSRLSSYSSASGSRQLLHLAELERDTQDGIDIDESWFEAEQKTQGLWKLGANLLQSSRREGGVLPPAVERRVHLAGLAEDVLLSPAAERAVTKIDADSVQPSAEVDELVALKPLTAPDSSTHYHSSSVAAAGDDPSGRPRVNSVAQSLIDLKFGVKAEPSLSSSATVLLDDDDKPLYDAPESFAGVPSSSTSDSTAAAGPSTTPHMDYRIVLSQSMRSRARSIFAHSPLPSLPASYCRRHRVRSCAVCAALVAAASERESNHGAMRRLNVPGAGLRGRGADGEAKKPLVGLVPAFLKLSAALLEDVRERGGRSASTDADALFAAAAVDAGAAGKGKGRAGAGDEDEDEQRRHDLHVTAEWFDLLTALLVQACLEGYLVDGWTGTEGVETLFGVGCGVWEGRGWSAPTPAAAVAAPAAASSSAATSRRASVQHHVEDDGDWSESDEDDDEGETDDEAERQRVREEETRALVCAAKVLFGSRDVAQADYERGMRDRTHEFLNVSQSKDLHQHLDALNTKYPLSQFEDALVDFIEAGVRLLGKPALAKHDPRSTASSSDSDPYALVRYFAPTARTTAPTRAASPALDDAADRAGKRRRVD
ncbi:uncharacterized protein RHOBADRAFT_55716 [Rhodotorula graminis WP1]|uniref:Uncharacterized protein n=1 Tax=Rhodotorula graminis (strain WP1) TaxID=578459 RepID=A0A0P9ELK2_RHOGW|nr:uncharacterized protein RHOBADRAFT_55716 [Rhodotorula graminis WP1]KPV72619.1 hypothetical protein RHOBADRAFT_55716 [Rhodotorula graminis WP1]